MWGGKVLHVGLEDLLMVEVVWAFMGGCGSGRGPQEEHELVSGQPGTCHAHPP